MLDSMKTKNEALERAKKRKCKSKKANFNETVAVAKPTYDEEIRQFRIHNEAKTFVKQNAIEKYF